MTIDTLFQKITRCLISTSIGVLLLISAAGAQSEVTYQSRNISGGINEKDEILEPNESTVLKNAILRSIGKSTKRAGSSLALNLTEVGGISALKHYYKLNDSTSRLLIESDNGWQMWDGTDIFDLTTTGTTANTEFFVAGNVAWRVNPSDNNVTYDGTDLSLSGNTNTEPPRGGAGLYHKGRVLIYRNTANPDYFWYSAVGPEVKDLKTFDRSVNAIKIDSGDNQELVALVEYGLTDNPGLLALKENSTYYIDTSASSPASWVISKLFSDVGCIARRTAVKIGGDVFFLSRDGSEVKVRTIQRTQFDKTNVTDIPLSDKIETTLSDISDANISKAAAIAYDGFYILSFPSGSSTVNDTTVVYDTITKSWVEFTGWAPAVYESYIDGNVEKLFYGDNTNTHVVELFTGTDDQGSAINYQEESQPIDMGAANFDKVWQSMEVTFAQTGSNDESVDVFVKLDDGGYTQLGSIDLNADLPTLPLQLPFMLKSGGVVRQTFDLSQFGRGRTLTWKIQQNSTGIGSGFERLGVFLWAFIENQEWEGEPQ